MLAPYMINLDTRGGLTGIINSGSWEEINVVETDEGSVRGGHYHKETIELFYIISGEIEVEVAKGDAPKEMFRVGEGAIFIVEPLEVHTFRCLTKCKWINVLSRRTDTSCMDFYK